MKPRQRCDSLTLVLAGVVLAAGMSLGAHAWAQGANPGPPEKGGDKNAASTAQSAAPDTAGKTFEVATIKPAPPLDAMKMAADMQAGKMPRVGARVEGLSANYYYTTLKELVAAAYGEKEYQVSGPDWLTAQRFDVEARMPEGSTKDDAPKMLQALLAERFKLVAHKETSERQVLALVVGKDGPKLKLSPPDEGPIDADAPLKKGEMQINSADGPMRVSANADGSSTINMGSRGIIKQRLDMATQTYHIDSSKVTMTGFADMLTNVMQIGGGNGRQVVDMTGLKGNYQVSLSLSLASLMQAARDAGVDLPARSPAAGGDAGAGAGAGAGGTAAAPAEASDPGGGGATIYASVQTLGLKLEQRKAPVEMIVVDSMEKTPTEN